MSYTWNQILWGANNQARNTELNLCGIGSSSDVPTFKKMQHPENMDAYIILVAK